ncbi:MAG: hypothetical protein AB9866_27270 [Syntrophobacteraceae bacterium]
MRRRTFTSEQILGKPRDAEILLRQRRNVGAVGRKLEAREQT